jgi:transcriptional regulator with XRE-family HTH domain
MQTLGKTIRILRQAKEMKQGALAAAAKISVPFLSLVENAERQPSISVLRRIAEALGVPPEVLILMSVGPESGLTTSDVSTNEISENVNKLIKLEVRLQAMLSGNGNTDAPKDDHTI